MVTEALGIFEIAQGRGNKVKGKWDTDGACEKPPSMELENIEECTKKTWQG